MAAGLGFKTFATGDVLTAGDTNGYLMQGVLVFASAAARDSAITSPQEGQFAYLKDTNVTMYYTGSAWANLDTTGMTNPMTTTGDTIYSSSGSTPARLGIGSTGQVLTVAGGIPSWATPAATGFKGVSLYKSGATQTIANNTNTAVTFDSEFFDTDGFHSTSSNTSRVTIPAGMAGYYSIVSTAVVWDINGSGVRGVGVYKNGVALTSSFEIIPNASVYVSNALSTVVQLAVGDYIELYIKQTSGGGLIAYLRDQDFPFTVTYLGA